MSVSQLPEGVSLVDLLRELAELRRVVVVQADRIAELERRLTKDSSTSSRPPASDAVGQEASEETVVTDPIWAEPGKTTGFASSSRRLADDPDAVFEVAPDKAISCVTSQVLPDDWSLEWIFQEDGELPRLESKFASVDSARYDANYAQLGVAVTRNQELARATGDLVQVLDQDDVLLPAALATLIPAFNRENIHWAIGQADDLLPSSTPAVVRDLHGSWVCCRW